MRVDVDVRGRRALLLGAPHTARRAVRRWTHAGANVLPVATPGELPGVLASLGAAAGGALVVAVEDHQPGWSGLLRELRRTHTVVTEPAAEPGGQVVLVGGGPGPGELLTVAGREALAEADVVLADRLAPREELAALTGGAEVVDVGKQPGRHRLAQHEIEQLLVQRARAGQTVVRLKGGDPFLLGRGGEEVAACRAAGVPVRVVPGVSSAFAVPAAEGIPVTHRGEASAVTVVSGHDPLEADRLAGLARVGGTIVVLMGVGTLQQTLGGLLAAGMDPTTPVAVVQHGYRPTQASGYATLAEAVGSGALTAARSPAVLVVGEVVRHGNGWPEQVRCAVAGAGEPAVGSGP